MVPEINLIDGKYTLGEKSVVGDPRRKWEDRTFVGRVDRLLVNEPLIVGIVADGVGSADNGARGAELAIKTVLVTIRNSQGTNIPNLIENAIKAANLAVYQENETQGSDGLTTLVVGVVYKGRFYVGNVGDSRAYWVQSSGRMMQLTRDHTYYNFYGGDPNAEDAGIVVNAIGKNPTVKVDLGFYLKGDDLEQAYRLGLAGLPLQKGDSIVLCTDGLIKKDPKGERFALDEEIIEAVKAEYRPNMAAIKMVSRAEGRRADDNVSAVTIQYLTPENVVQIKASTKWTKQVKNLRRVLLGILLIGLVGVIMVLGRLLWQTIQENANISNRQMTPVVITNTPMPTLTPTLPVDPGKARVDQVNGSGASVEIGQYLESGKRVETGSSGVQIVLGATMNNVSLLYLFPGTAAEINFREKLAPVLEAGTIYIQPGSGVGEVHFKAWGDVIASVTGSRMIVEVKGTDIWVYCFEGTCRLDYGLEGFRIPVGYKQVFHASSGQREEPVLMGYNEKWKWEQKCNDCMYDIIPTPTPRPIIQISTPTPTDEPRQPRPSDTPVPPPINTPVPPTNTPVPPTNTPVPPTDTPVPPTNTPVPPTDTPVPPTNTPVPPTDTPLSG